MTMKELRSYHPRPVGQKKKKQEKQPCVLFAIEHPRPGGQRRGKTIKTTNARACARNHKNLSLLLTTSFTHALVQSEVHTIPDSGCVGDNWLDSSGDNWSINDVRRGNLLCARRFKLLLCFNSGCLGCGRGSNFLSFCSEALGLSKNVH